MTKMHLLALASLVGCGTDDLEPVESVESYVALSTSSRGDDIVVLGSTSNQIVVAFAKDFPSQYPSYNDPRAGAFDLVFSPGSETFAILAKTPGVKRISGDFNRDGRLDLALVGIAGWSILPTAMSNGDGTFTTRFMTVGSSFQARAAAPGVSVLVGDFNNDRMSDIALTGAAGWATIPVAFSYGDGRFDIRDGTSPVAAFTPGAPPDKILVGDYNRDGYSDIAVVGVSSQFMPIAFGAGGGNWAFTYEYVESFNAWAATPNVRAFVGDYNKDGFSDIALTGGAGWATIPVATSTGGGRFRITNSSAPGFAGPATLAGMRSYVGDYNGDGYSDLMLAGSNMVSTYPAAISQSNGAFETRALDAGNLTFYSSRENARLFPGDFNADGRTDLAVIRGDSGERFAVPVAFAEPTHWFTTNHDTLGFLDLAGQPGTSVFVGRVN